MGLTMIGVGSSPPADDGGAAAPAESVPGVEPTEPEAAAPTAQGTSPANAVRARAAEAAQAGDAAGTMTSMSPEAIQEFGAGALAQARRDHGAT